MHIPVLLEEVIKYMCPKKGDKYIDATINGGGHALAILEKIRPGGKLLGIELDPVICSNLGISAREFIEMGELQLVNDSYTNLGRIAASSGFGDADGILFDLGMSTWHIVSGERGFTFRKDEPLDMRYDVENKCQDPNDKFQINSKFAGQNERAETAADILNNYPEKDIADIIYKYGEERYSRQIARGIVESRRKNPIITTFQLVEIIKQTVPFGYRLGRLHFATRTFQALRIAVNHELENIKTGLEQAVQTAGEGGRIAVISFHSLEDRIVKNYFKEQCDAGTLDILTKKPVQAHYLEKRTNPNSRSAKLRAVVKK